MGNSVVGIKTARGEFFSIIDPAAGKKRRVVLVPSRKDQENVKIELFQQYEDDPEELIFLSALFIEQIGRSEDGESEIELILGSDSDLNIYATAKDLVSQEVKSISVATKELGNGEYSIPTSEFDDLSGVIPLDAAEDEPSSPEVPPGSRYAAGEEFGIGRRARSGHHGIRPLYLTIFIVIGLMIILGVAYIILRNTQSVPEVLEKTSMTFRFPVFVSGIISGLFPAGS